MKKIGRRQAMWYRKEAMRLEMVLANQRNRWASEFRPGMVNIETLTLSDASFAKIETARKLGHAVIVIPDSGNRVLFYADKL